MNMRNIIRRRRNYGALLVALCLQFAFTSTAAITGLPPSRESSGKAPGADRQLDYDYEYGYGYYYGGGYGRNSQNCPQGRPCHPTRSPTISPMPTGQPSPQPTSNIWNIVQEADGSWVSTCKTKATSGNNMFTKPIEFVYYLFLPSDVQQNTADSDAAAVETHMQEALTKRALSCSDTSGNIAVTELSSRGNASVVGNCQDVTPEASQTCWQVSAEVTATITSSLTESETLALFSDWIKTSLTTAVDGNTILNIEFQGFINVNGNSGSDLAGPTGTTLPRQEV